MFCFRLYSLLGIAEPLYNSLAEKNEKIEFVNDVDEIPSLEEFDDETKKEPKLIIFDDLLIIKTDDLLI
jgi:hypothetical protein